jgi:hypothetical protein
MQWTWEEAIEYNFKNDRGFFYFWKVQSLICWPDKCRRSLDACIACLCTVLRGGTECLLYITLTSGEWIQYSLIARKEDYIIQYFSGMNILLTTRLWINTLFIIRLEINLLFNIPCTMNALFIIRREWNLVHCSLVQLIHYRQPIICMRKAWIISVLLRNYYIISLINAFFMLCLWDCSTIHNSPVELGLFIISNGMNITHPVNESIVHILLWLFIYSSLSFGTLIYSSLFGCGVISYFSVERMYFSLFACRII